MFASNGEALKDFDLFHPDRMASRILDMGDLLTLIEQAEKTFDAEQSRKAAEKIMAGSGDFGLDDFLAADAGRPQDGPDEQDPRHDARHGADEGRHRATSTSARSTGSRRSSTR
jgi:hypothetical protein